MNDRDPYRTLLLLRHAKSDYPDGVADHERPLAARGDPRGRPGRRLDPGARARHRRGAVLDGHPDPSDAGAHPDRRAVSTTSTGSTTRRRAP